MLLRLSIASSFFLLLALVGCDSKEPSTPDGGDSSTPDAGLSCVDARASASQKLAALRNVPSACDAHDDCSLVKLEVSCSVECSTMATSDVVGTNDALWSIASSVCAPVEASDRSCLPIVAKQGCGAVDTMVARCVEGACVAAPTPRCDLGCTPDAGDVCRGATSECDGCPAIPELVFNAPCSESEKVCTVGTYDVESITCTDEGSPGSLRWVPKILL